MLKKLIAAGAIIMLMQSCYNDKEELLYPNEFGAGDTTRPTYSGFVKPLLDSKCGTSCHATYMNYNGLKVVVDNGKFNDRVIVKADMPPAGPLSPQDRDKLKKWLDAGAPNN